MSILIPKTLALMAAQRQTAASRSTNPARRVQHCALGGVPMTAWGRPLSKFRHTSNLCVFIGQVSFDGGEGVGIFGDREHGGGGGGGQPFRVWVEATKVNKIKLKVRIKDVAKALEAIIYSKDVRSVTVGNAGVGNAGNSATIGGAQPPQQDPQTCTHPLPETYVTQPQPDVRTTIVKNKATWIATVRSATTGNTSGETLI
ncbi:hypothetical protein R6Q57_012161 [Mikania cordata]